MRLSKKTKVYRVEGDTSLRGARVIKIRESKRTGSWTVRLLEDYGTWEKGTELPLMPYELTAI